MRCFPVPALVAKSFLPWAELIQTLAGSTYKLLRIVLRSLPARSWFESRHKIAERSHDAHPSETSGLLFEIVDPKMPDGPAHALARTRDHSPVEGVGIQGKLTEGS
jgi:hypothetical protein